MPKALSSDAYKSFLRALVAARKRLGVTQIELGERLGKPQTFISRFERGARRLDVVEFYAIARALRTDPVELFADVMKEMPDTVEI